MIEFSECKVSDIQIPDNPTKSKSKKLLKLGKMWFFIQETKDFIKIYEVSTKRLVMAPGNKSKGLDLLVRKLHLVQEALDRYKKETEL